jgi:phosphoglycolate phosphatase
MNLAAFRLNVKSESCIYVGDHHRDIAAGNATGMTTVAALYGYIEDNDKPESWNADYFISEPIDLLKSIIQSS